jgi:hypothetical protein
MGQDNRLQRCLTTIEVQMVMRKLHEGQFRRHFATKITQRKTLDARYWWPTLYKHVYDYYRFVMHVKEHEEWRFKVLQN